MIFGVLFLASVANAAVYRVWSFFDGSLPFGRVHTLDAACPLGAWPAIVVGFICFAFLIAQGFLYKDSIFEKDFLENMSDTFYKTGQAGPVVVYGNIPILFSILWEFMLCAPISTRQCILHFWKKINVDEALINTASTLYNELEASMQWKEWPKLESQQKAVRLLDLLQLIRVTPNKYTGELSFRVPSKSNV